MDLLSEILPYNPDLLVLCGFLHILSKEFIDRFPFIINLHPSKSGGLVGLNCIERAYNAFKNNEITETGVMVHYVIPQVDRGKVLIEQACPIYPSDSLMDLEERVHSIEHQLIVQGVRLALNDIEQKE